MYMKVLEYIKNIFKMTKNLKWNLVKVNLIFIFIFLNIWDFVISHSFLNGMILGIVMFGPAAFLWFVGTFRAVALVTLISIFEFMMILVFVLQGFELGGASSTLKSVYWIPFLAMAGVNTYWGLKMYSEHREKKIKI